MVAAELALECEGCPGEGDAGSRSEGAPRDQLQRAQVLVALLSGKTITVDIAPYDTVDDFRRKLFCKTAVPWTPQLRLLQNGKQLASLRGCEGGSIIRVAGTLCGGGKVERLKAAFKKYDANGNGRLGFEEFYKLLLKGNPDFEEAQAESLFKVVDADLSGEVDFDEFIDYLYDHKRIEDFILAPSEDSAEEDAKAVVLGKSACLRASASKAVKERGLVWAKLSWKDRLEEVLYQERSLTQGQVQAPTPHAKLPAASAEPPEAPQASGAAEGGFSLFAAAQNLTSASLSLTPAGAGESKNSIASMSQKGLADYSLAYDDLTWAGRDRETLAEMTAFKDRVSTAGGPMDAVEVQRYLAKGTAGWVFLARRRSSGEAVALKLIRMTQARTGLKEWYVSKLMRKSGLVNIVFTDEVAYVLPRSEAPPIIEQELQNAGPVPYYVCFVQELMSGGSLEGLAKDGRLTPEMMFKGLHDVASTLALMHEQGLQHRDVKPENVLVRMEGDALKAAKLCDFGSAEIGNNPASRADDVRRFGVMLFSLATGEGWTKNRLIHESHDALVVRLSQAVRTSGHPSLQKLPETLGRILDGGLEMKQVVPLMADLNWLA